MPQKETNINYKLSISAESRKTVTTGKPFKVTYHIRNEGNNVFPGGVIPVVLSWACIAPFLAGYHVNIIMFLVYVVILSLPLVIKTSLSKTSIAFIVLGLYGGLLSYATVQLINSILLNFMDTRGIIHVIFVGPPKEEIVKFVFFLASFFILRLGSKGERFYTNKEVLVLLGVLVGLSLAGLENLIDYGYLNATNTFLRTLMSWPQHMLSTGISAYGFYESYTTRKIYHILVALALAIIIHVVVNFYSTFGGLLFAPR